MQQLVLNEYEKIASNDLNNSQLAVYQALQDQILYNMFANNNGVVGGSFLMTYVSALVGSLAPGSGFFYDSSQTGFNPKYREIMSLAAIPVNFTAADPTHNRIDVVSLAPNFAVTATASRYVKAGGTGPVALQTVNKLMEDGYTLTVTAGTPGSSPVAPALPAGNIVIAHVLITAATGMTGSGSITDERLVLSALTVTAINHVIATGSSIQAQLDELDDACEKVKAINPGSASPYTMSTTLLTGDNGRLFLVNSANGAMIFDLPSPVANFHFTIKDIAGSLGTNAITLHRFGSENIENLAADYVMSAPYGEWSFWSDGTNWFIGGR
jgi:hypothetical protein